MIDPIQHDAAQTTQSEATEDELLRYERRRPESEFARRTAGRDHFWKTSPDLMGIVGLDTRPMSLNPAWMRVLGYDEGTLLGMPLMGIVHEDDKEQFVAALAKVRRGERISGLDLRLKHAADGSRIVCWDLAPGAGAFFALGRDVSEERNIQERLRQAQKMEAVGQLTGGVAHDFNNLLAGIVGSLELIGKRLQQGRTADLDRYLNAAMASAQRAAALTHRLLAFSRRQPLERRSVEVNEVVSGLDDLLRRTLGPSISLEMRLADDPWGTVCDRAQLESAILNLCINARDAMPGGGRLTVETGNTTLDDPDVAPGEAAPGQYVTITVRDQGLGMSADVLAHVLDPFFTTKPVGQGTGLGIPMVYNFAKEAGGSLRFASVEGQGTTVRLLLPHHRQTESQEVKAAPAEIPCCQGAETILIVEDEPVIRGLLVEVLEDHGYTVLEASDGSAGLKLLQADISIDLLVADIGLPGMDGRRLASRAKAVRPNVQTLLITGYGDVIPGDVVSQAEVEVLMKPFDVDTLMRNVRRLLVKANGLG